MIFSLVVLFLCFYNGAGQVLTAEDSSRKVSFEYGGLGDLLSRKGAYISQDPIRLEAGLTKLYAYVHDVNSWVDPWGLNPLGGSYGLIREINIGGEVNHVPAFGSYKNTRACLTIKDPLSLWTS